ncbi:hypothetical protein NDU88_006594 [Pleurodeles waltl]|uniref:Uncharacterized protein n=1 Tax=Pleurodeles waltl TaxID=8319 RepID=A0AAV7UM21_PLEWA|nr:hypothetical protein NDU88_006594 [Pleurodeles waltl]
MSPCLHPPILLVPQGPVRAHQGASTLGRAVPTTPPVSCLLHQQVLRMTPARRSSTPQSQGHVRVNRHLSAMVHLRLVSPGLGLRCASTIPMVNARPGPRAPERRYAVGEGHRCHLRPAALHLASPPSSAPLGPSSGTPFAMQLKVRRANDRSPVPPSHS